MRPSVRSSLRPLGWGDAAALFSLWLLVALWFWPLAGAGRVLANGDLFTYFYSYWSEAARAFQAGRLPLWNPYLFMGAPFMANSQVGLFYPPNWLLWKLLPGFQALHASIVLHLGLAAGSVYLWGRVSLRMGRLGAWTAGLVYAFSGYLGAQVEHVNQLQGLAWLPLLLLLWDTRLPALPVVLALILLSGHTQTAFIALTGLAAYGLGPLAWQALAHRFAPSVRRDVSRRQTGHPWRALGQAAARYLGAAALGTGLAAVQLIPTLELTRLSLRSGGLPLREAVSFSLPPRLVGRALLPGVGDLPSAEFVAYIGVVGLMLAGLGLLTRRVTVRHAGVLWLVALGLFFALGGYNPLYLLLARFAPGFAHFRVPARWLALAVAGAAALSGWTVDGLWTARLRTAPRQWWWLLAGLGLLFAWAAAGLPPSLATVLSWVLAAGGGLLGLLSLRRARRAGVVALLVVLEVELFLASSPLTYRRATAPQAYTTIRPAVAHMLAAGQAEQPPSRFLSMSDIFFDPGDLAELRLIYGPQLSADALYDLVVATKHKEVLGPNLPMAFGIPAVDGYDGGLLPLHTFAALQQLILPADTPTFDGRLREYLERVPDGRWLSLFNARYVVTDKVFDAWLDGVFYDLQFSAALGQGEEASVADVPPFEGDTLGLVTYLHGADALPDDAPVAEVRLGFADGSVQTFTLRAGRHTAEGLYAPGPTAHAQAQVGGHFWPGQPQGNDYVARLPWGTPAVPVAVSVRGLLSEGELVVRGISLIDERTGSFRSLLLSDQGRFRLVHSGDVKIYENLDVLPRAFVARCVFAPDDETALSTMQRPDFDPGREVVLQSPCPPGPVQVGTHTARVLSYAPERVEVEVDGDSPGYLVLTDAWYPGWQASVDGVAVSVERADIAFRAVPVEGGTHRVVWVYRPASLWIGFLVSGMVALYVLRGAVRWLTWGDHA